MSDTDKKPDQEKGDEILRRMLNTPPKPHTEKPPRKNEDGDEPGD
ncbi:hypothetical protein [Roseibium salinum]|uniref:Uncharacterized protein n=1 Tax=Roseibium salinum TaxID=1604349 RepID=A0ABT3R675_9HYPH|nr:hypothetical protein [Roseibium sp. DSM 29163]MCX2724791.1 hypothetical protein [Roseibium sp. DSM 29163]